MQRLLLFLMKHLLLLSLQAHVSNIPFLYLFFYNLQIDVLQHFYVGREYSFHKSVFNFLDLFMDFKFLKATQLISPLLLYLVILSILHLSFKVNLRQELRGNIILKQHYYVLFLQFILKLLEFQQYIQSYHYHRISNLHYYYQHWGESQSHLRIHFPQTRIQQEEDYAFFKVCLDSLFKTDYSTLICSQSRAHFSIRLDWVHLILKLNCSQLTPSYNDLISI